MRFANQKQIIITREEIPKGTKRQFVAAFHDNLIGAMKSLTPAAFEVYLCLLFNKNGFKLDFSPEHIKDMTGLCKDTIRKSMSLLEMRGYLKCLDDNKYEFSENGIDFHNI